MSMNSHAQDQADLTFFLLKELKRRRDEVALSVKLLPEMLDRMESELSNSINGIGIAPTVLHIASAMKAETSDVLKVKCRIMFHAVEAWLKNMNPEEVYEGISHQLVLQAAEDKTKMTEGLQVLNQAIRQGEELLARAAEEGIKPKSGNEGAKENPKENPC